MYTIPTTRGSLPVATIIAALIILTMLGSILPAGAPAMDEVTPESDTIGDPPSTRAPPGPGWRSEWMQGDNNPLIEVAAGELDSDSPGDELVAVGEGNKALLISGHHDSWEKELLYTDPWWLYTVEIGDADLRHDGNEIITSGWSDHVTMIYRNGSQWETELLWDAPDWVYNVGIGDMDPDRPGDEILVAGEDRSLHMLFIDGGEWNSKRLWTDTDYLDGLWVGDIYPGHPGDEALVAGGSGNITMVAIDGDGSLAAAMAPSNTTADGWWAGTAFDYPGKGAPIAVVMGNAGGFEGPARTSGVPPGAGSASRESGPPMSAFVGGVGGILAQAWPDRTDPTAPWNVTEVWKDTEHLYGLDMGDVDPTSEGDEVVAVGWSGNATVLSFTPADDPADPGDGTWTTATAHDDTALLYGTAVGDFDPWHPGYEVAVTNSDGDVIKVQYDETGFGLFPARDADSAPAGGNVTFPFTIISRGGFDGDVDLSAPDLPDGVTASFSVDPVELGSGGSRGFSLTLSLDDGLTPGSAYVIKVVGEGGGSSADSAVTLTVLLPDEPDFTLGVLPPSATPNADFKAFFTVSIGSLGGFTDVVNLTLEGEARGMKGEFGPASVTAPGTATLTITTSANTPRGTHTLTVVGQGGGHIHAAGITLDVQEVEKKSFTLTASATSFAVGPNGTVLIDINVQSLFGWNDMVTLNLTHDLAGVTASLSALQVIPTGNVTLNVTAGPDLTPSLGTIHITATAEDGTTRELDISFELLEEGPHFFLEIEPAGDHIEAGQGAEFIVRIVPVLGFDDPVHLELKGFGVDGASHEFYHQAGVNDTFEPGATVKLSLYTSSMVPPGNYTLKVQGTSGGLEDAEEISLRVDEPEEPEPDDGDWWTGLMMVVIIVVITAVMFYNIRRGRGKVEKEEDVEDRRRRDGESGANSPYR